jgi:LysM repeat protein
MQKQKRICFRLTTNRILSAVLLVVGAVNLTIVGVAFNISFPFATSTVTGTFLVPTSTVGDTEAPTLAPTQTITREPSATPTYTFTSTDTATPTASFTPVYTPTFTPSLIPCIPLYSWPTYLVQRGDTLFSLAQATGSSVDELKRTNCLADNTIYVGQLLYIARLPTMTPTASATEVLTACAGFEDLNRGAAFQIGEKFITSNIIITVDQFALVSGVPAWSGIALVSGLGKAGGFGNEIQVNNVNLNFYFSTPPSGLSILFGEYGGDVNININGEFVNFANFADMNGRVIGGANIAVLKGYGNDAGFLQLSGIIKSFAVGGQELWIDNVCTQASGR